MPILRVGLAGLGNAASTLHLPALKSLSEIEVSGGSDPSEERRSTARENFGLATFATLEEMLRNAAPDVLIVCTPPSTHRDLAIRALESGVDVICEKPLATSVGEADEIVSVAQRTGRQLAMNHEFREMPAFRSTLDALNADTSGVVFAQAWQLMNLPPWAEPGWRAALLHGVLYEAGIHLVDFILEVFGELPQAVTAVTSSGDAHDDATDAVAVLTMEFSRGRLGHVIQHRLCPGETHYFEVRADTRSASYRVSYGGRARVSAGLLRSTLPHVRIEMGTSGIAWSEKANKRKRLATNPKNAPMVATARLLEKTLDAFRTRQAPPVSGAAGRDALRTIAAAYVSARDGRRVSVTGADARLIEEYRFES